jgi:hypothetical protein
MSLVHLNLANRTRAGIPHLNTTALAGIALLIIFGLAIYADSQSPGTMPDAIASMVVFP